MSPFNYIARLFHASPSSPAQLGAAKGLVEAAIRENTVTVFSKSYCPYCHSTKSLLSSKFPDATMKVIELDKTDDGHAIQSYLQEKTGQRTVPNVFVGQQHVGGNDDTQAAYKRGELAKLIQSES